ncbi:MAG: hypothetical protein ABFQ53_03620, partial [Patescibacteria group bacterium]
IMVAVIMTVAYKDREKKDLQAVAREVTASIREAQNNSLTGKQKGTGTMPCTFQIVFSGGTYQINHETRDLDTHDCRGSFDEFFETQGLPLSVSVDSMQALESGTSDTYKNVTDIRFDVPYGKMTFGTDEDIYDGAELILEKNDRYYHICLHTTGLIEDFGMNEDPKPICKF